MLRLYSDTLWLIGSALFPDHMPPTDHEMDWPGIFCLGGKHQILPLLYAGIKASKAPVPEDIRKEFKTAFLTGMSVEMGQQAALAPLPEIFERNGIDYLPLKGMRLKKLYPDPSLRTMGDADILIRMEQYEQIRSLLPGLGFTEGTGAEHEYVWDRGSALHLELHKSLVPTESTDLFAYFGDGWKRARPCAEGSHCYTLSTEDEFVFLFAHFTKHYRGSGIGIRHMTDLAVYLHAHPEIDMDYIYHELAQIGLEVFLHNVIDTLQVWFGQKTPDPITESITDWIFKNGVYGDLLNKKKSQLLKDASQSCYWVARAHYTITRLFPAYSGMRSEYPCLKKHPWLLPITWIIRIFSFLSPRKARRAMREFRALRTDQVHIHEAHLHQVGLTFK